MTTQIRRSDSDVSSGQIDMTSASKPGRRRIVLLLTALGALVLTVPIVVIALVNWTGDPASTVIPSGPAAIPPAPASPSSSVSSGPTVTHPTQHLPAVPRVPERYRAVPLGFAGEVTAVNDRGDVVGARAFPGTVTHPFLWRDGQLTDLGELKPTVDGSGTATDINNRAEIVGVSRTESKVPPVRERAFIWRNGVMTALMALDTESVANAINDRGQVVGTYDLGEVTHAFLWQDGVLTDLGAGWAVDINNRGQIAGGNANGPWIWYQGRFTYLDAPAQSLQVLALNTAGWAIGTGQVERENDMPDGRAYLWRPGTVIDLGKIGVGFTTPVDINDHGQIVGWTNRNNFDDAIPFLWQGGQMIDLSKRGIPRVGTVLRRIDDRGRLFATATLDGREQVVMYV